MTYEQLRRLLAAASREFVADAWVFTGFHLPVLAMATARRRGTADFAAVYEAGAAVTEDHPTVATSTTDYAAYDGAASWVGDSATALLSLSRRYDRVLLDATNVDVRGRINATAIGPYAHPTVRLAGGGGAADAAAAAKEVVLLHGRPDAVRLVRRVENVTACPTGVVRLIAPWGLLDLGEEPRVTSWLAPPSDELRASLTDRGVDATTYDGSPPEAEDLTAAADVIVDAAARGYVVARRALDTIEELEG